MLAAASFPLARGTKMYICQATGERTWKVFLGIAWSGGSRAEEWLKLIYDATQTLKE